MEPENTLDAAELGNVFLQRRREIIATQPAHEGTKVALNAALHHRQKTCPFYIDEIQRVKRLYAVYIVDPDIYGGTLADTLRKLFEVGLPIYRRLCRQLGSETDVHGSLLEQLRARVRNRSEAYRTLHRHVADAIIRMPTLEVFGDAIAYPVPAYRIVFDQAHRIVLTPLPGTSDRYELQIDDFVMTVRTQPDQMDRQVPLQNDARISKADRLAGSIVLTHAKLYYARQIWSIDLFGISTENAQTTLKPRIEKLVIVAATRGIHIYYRLDTIHQYMHIEYAYLEADEFLKTFKLFLQCFRVLLVIPPKQLSMGWPMLKKRLSAFQLQGIVAIKWCSRRNLAKPNKAGFASPSLTVEERLATLHDHVKYAYERPSRITDIQFKICSRRN